MEILPASPKSVKEGKKMKKSLFPNPSFKKKKNLFLVHEAKSPGDQKLMNYL